MDWRIALAVLVLVVGGTASWYQLSKPGDDALDTGQVTETAVAPPVMPILREPAAEVTPLEPDPMEEEMPAMEPIVVDGPPLIAPPATLDGSDKIVLKLVTEVAPKLSTWLLPTEQIRKWVLAIDLLADGTLPKKYRPVDYPMPLFKVDKSDGSNRSNSANFARTQALIDTITAIDPATFARYYHHWLPILETAYDEQGKPGSFDVRLRRAIDQLLSVELQPDSPRLVQPHVFYQYADPSLEKRSDVDKFMWRLGSDNMQRVQNYLRELEKHL